MTTKTYKVSYVADDGTLCSFRFKTERSMQRVRRNDGFDIPQPFMIDMNAAAIKTGSNPESAMARHGRFVYTRIRKIQCIDTGTTRYFI